jgi:phospholipase/carboxylesterase
MGLADELPRELQVVTFRAPFTHGPGYSWFETRWDERGLFVDQDAAVRSLEMLMEELERLPAALGISPAKTFLSGFSQGAIMTSGVALRKPQAIDGAVLLSGRLLPQFALLAADAVLDSFPMLVQHGVQDPVLPVEGGRELRDLFARLGARVAYHEYPMGHQVSYESLMDLSAWLESQLA